MYKAQLTHWLGEGLPKAVAVKTLKGTISAMMNMLTGKASVASTHAYVKNRLGGNILVCLLLFCLLPFRLLQFCLLLFHLLNISTSVCLYLQHCY